MKFWMKILLIGIISIMIFACEDNDSKSEADIEITNYSQFSAKVWIYNLGYSPITVTVPGEYTTTVTIEDGDAGLNVEGGRAIVEYSFSYLEQVSDQVVETYVNLSPDEPAVLSVNNSEGCLVVENYSTNSLGDIWINIDYGPTQEIEPWGDFIDFYDPAPAQSVNVNVEFQGYTLKSGEVWVNVESDVATILELHPDACGIWVDNNSNETISAVYLSPTEDDVWGSNDLDGFIYPGETDAWICDGNMMWDIWIVSSDSEDFFMENYLYIDDILIIDYGTRNESSEDPIEMKRLNAQNYNTTHENAYHEQIKK